jgi:hypothetical protein
MRIEDRPAPDSEREGVSAALARAAEKARRLAEQTGTPFVIRGSKPDQSRTAATPPPTADGKPGAGT